MAAGDIVVVSQTLSSRIPCVKYSLFSISDSLEEAWSLIGVVRCRKHLPCPGNSSDRGVLSERFKVGQKSWHVLGSFIPFGPFDLLSFPPNIRRIVKSLTPFSLDFQAPCHSSTFWKQQRALKNVHSNGLLHFNFWPLLLPQTSSRLAGQVTTVSATSKLWRGTESLLVGSFSPARKGVVCLVISQTLSRIAS